GDRASARVSCPDGSPQGTRGRRGDLSARVSYLAVSPQGSRRGSRDSASAHTGCPDGTPQGTRGRRGDIPASVSYSDGTPQGAGEGDGVAHPSSGLSCIRRYQRRLRTERLPCDLSEMMRYPGFIPTRVRTLDTFTQPKWLNKLLKEIIKKEVSWG